MSAHTRKEGRLTVLVVVSVVLTILKRSNSINWVEHESINRDYSGGSVTSYLDITYQQRLQVQV